MKPPNKFRLFAALIVAAVFSFWTRDGWRRIWHAVTMWFDWLLAPEPYVDDAIYEKRMAACRACPIYVRLTGTCGSPLRFGFSKAGCWCFQEASARLKDKECWLDSNGIQSPYSWNAKIPVDPKAD